MNAFKELAQKIKMNAFEELAQSWLKAGETSNETRLLLIGGGATVLEARQLVIALTKNLPDLTTCLLEEGQYSLSGIKEVLIEKGVDEDKAWRICVKAKEVQQKNDRKEAQENKFDIFKTII